MRWRWAQVRWRWVRMRRARGRLHQGHRLRPKRGANKTPRLPPKYAWSSFDHRNTCRTYAACLLTSIRDAQALPPTPLCYRREAPDVFFTAAKLILWVDVRGEDDVRGGGPPGPFSQVFIL